MLTHTYLTIYILQCTTVLKTLHTWLIAANNTNNIQYIINVNVLLLNS